MCAIPRQQPLPPLSTGEFLSFLSVFFIFFFSRIESFIVGFACFCFFSLLCFLCASFEMFLGLSLSVSVSRICSQKIIIMFEALRPVVVISLLSFSFSFSFSFLVWFFSGFSAFFVCCSFFLLRFWSSPSLLFCFSILPCLSPSR